MDIHENIFSSSRTFYRLQEILDWRLTNNTSFLLATCTDPDSNALILSTSGTTGTPKGVRMPNRQVAGYASAMADACRYKKDNCIFSFANYTFDVFITDICGVFLQAPKYA
ncbi:hypothetical protein GQ44DRAFT_818681 [Phaeosphaeriaceae sp. PMI808]|nr:hypothetical protein GQ44DRAFT_818681 [Phaeosphaeriaceae sp. PMI808]